MFALFVTAALAAAPPMEPVVLLQQGASTCAGSVIDDRGTIATAYHCVAAGGKLYVQLRDGSTTTAKVRSVSTRDDLAILDAPALAGRPWITVRETPAILGEEAWALGHPQGARPPAGFLAGTLRWSAAWGAVSAVGDKALQVSSPVNPGNSGGPIVDAEGQLIGVVSRRIGGDGLGFATRAERLTALLANPHRPGALGGTLDIAIVGLTYASPDGALSFGPRVGVSLRDRVFIDGLLAFGIQPKWDATRFDHVEWVGNEVRIGLRQRLFHGTGTVKLDIYGGGGTLQSMTKDGDRLVSGVKPMLLAGGAISFPGTGFGFDAAATYTDAGWAWRGALVVTWPGEIWMF